MHLRTPRWAVRTPAPNQGTKKGPHRASRRRVKAPTKIKWSAITHAKKGKNKGASARGGSSNNASQTAPRKKTNKQTQATPTNRRSTLCFLLFDQSFTQCVCFGRRNPNKRKRIAGPASMPSFQPSIKFPVERSLARRRFLPLSLSLHSSAHLFHI